MLLKELNHTQKNALFALISISLPVELRNGVSISSYSWSYEFLHFVLKELELPENYYDAYSVLVDSTYLQSDGDRENKLSVIEPFLQVLQIQALETHQHQMMVVISLLITLILKNKYDSKARTMIRRLVNVFVGTLNLEDSLVISNISLEQYIINTLQEEFKHFTEQSGISHQPDKKSTRSKYIRYAQIGVVSLGAGAAIALTGGLAAPAIAAVWGGFSFLTTAGVAVSLFGSAGAGLVGYKMMKRTKGLTEFAFESPEDAKTSKVKSAIMIMVSGYMVDKEDYKRAFGVVPDTLSLEERLIRYFRIHDPARVFDSTAIAIQYAPHEKKLFNMLTHIYRKDPNLQSSYIPNHPQNAISEEYKALIDNILITYVTSLSSSKIQLKTSQSDSNSNNVDDPTSDIIESIEITDSKRSNRRYISNIPTVSKYINDENLLPDCVVNEFSDDESESPSVKENGDGEEDISNHPLEYEMYSNNDNIEATYMKNTSSDDRSIYLNSELISQSKSQVKVDSLPEPIGRTNSMFDSMDCMNSIDSLLPNHLNPQMNTPSEIKKESKTLSDSNSSNKSRVSAQVTLEEAISFGTHVWHYNELNISGVYEPYLLRWETGTQIALGNSIAQMLVNIGMSVATQVIAETFFYSLATAIMLPAALLSLSSVIDSVWTLSVIQADLAGKELARALMLRPHGSRPVTLVGYSMGARVIFSCLCELFKARYGHLMNIKNDSKSQAQSQSRSNSKSQSDSTETISTDSKTRTRSLSTSTSASKMIQSSLSSSFSSIASTFRRRSSIPEQSSITAKSSLSSFIRKSSISSSHSNEGDLSIEDKTPLDEVERGNNSNNVDLNKFQDESDDMIKIDDDKYDIEDSDLGNEDSRTTDIDPSVLRIESIIQDVVLLGTPVKYKSQFWKWIRMIVSGRLINGYSKNDVVLGLVYRYQRFASAVAGVEEVPYPGIENVDLSHIVFGHLDYSKNIKDILEYIDLSQPETTVLY